MSSRESEKDKPSSVKTSRLTIKPGGPIELQELAELQPSVSEDEMSVHRLIGSAFKSYLTSSKELLEGRYSNIKNVAPAHMTEACLPIIFRFSDGILVRYDRKHNPELKVLFGVIQEDGGLSRWAPILTESFIHCPAELEGYDPGDQAIRLDLSLRSQDGVHLRSLGKISMFAIAPLSKLRTDAAQPKSDRPLPAISIRNEFDFMLEGELAPEEGGNRRQFLTRSRFRLPVGWEAVELYPPYVADLWDPNLAAQWAETDLLAAVVRRNLQDEEFRAIDPNAQARKRTLALLANFESLLNGPEEPLHQFIKDNPQLLSPAHDRVWSKLSLGAHKTDFVIREPSGEYLLVELEKPSQVLFRSDGQPRAELNHAIHQVIDWRRYLEDNLPTVQRELGLEGISSNPRGLIVIGRSASVTENNRRKLVAMENMAPRLKIMTYDDLLSNARAIFENILGPLWDPGPNAEVYFRS